MSDKIRVLFVDDEEDFLKYMAKRLNMRDLEVSAFTDAVEALETTEGQTFDVALLDLKMPEMDGEVLLKKLKERDPRVEVIILTGHGNIQSAFSTSRSGAYEYLLKPCDFEQLVKAISSAYAKRIEALEEKKARRVRELIERAQSMTGLGLLQQLKKIRDES